MINKRSMNLATNERGTLTGFPLVLLTPILVVAVMGLLAHWFLGGPSAPVAAAAQPTVVPATTAAPVSAAAAGQDEALWNAIDSQLQKMDMVKLQVHSEIKSVVIDGKNVAAHWAAYRLPDLYTAQQLTDILSAAAATAGATLTAPIQQTEQEGTGKVTTALYAEGTKVNAVQIDWIATSKPRICLIIDDAGYQKGAALEALYDFKVPVTCSIIPHTQYSNLLAQDFPSHGVEVMCHLPMEGHDHVARGAYKEYLKKGMDVETAKEEVKRGLADLPNCKGLNNHMGSVATLDLKLMTAVCEELKAENMFVIDSKTSAKAIVSKAAKAAGVPVAQREFFLDNQKTPGTVLKEMRLTAAYAQKHGLAVAIGHFNVITLKTLKVEVQKLKDQGFEFVYASEVVHQP